MLLLLVLSGGKNGEKDDFDYDLIIEGWLRGERGRREGRKKEGEGVLLRRY